MSRKVSARTQMARGVAFAALITCQAFAPVFADTPATPAGGSNPHAVSLYNLGMTAHKQGSPESAIIFFKRACDIDPTLTDAHYNLGVIYQSEKRYRDAIPRFEEVLKLKPNDPDAHYQLGLILQETGRLDEAKQHFSQIAPVSAHFNDAQTRLNAINAQMSGQAPAQSINQMGNQMGGGATQAQGQTSGYQSVTGTMLGSGATASSTTQFGSSPASGFNPPPTQSGLRGAGDNSVAAPQDTFTIQQTINPTMAVPDNGGQVAREQMPQQQIAPNGQMQTQSQLKPNIANLGLRIIATGFSAPAGLAFDRQGNLYVANYATNTIDRIAVDGSRAQFCSGVNLKGPIGLVVDDSGNVYAANYLANTVVRISPAGVATVIASGFRRPYYLTLDTEGNLYVSQQEDNTIVRVSLPKPGNSLISAPSPNGSSAR